MKKIIILMTGILVLAACEDFLVEEPLDQMAVDQYFSDPSHAYSSVNILYRTGVPAFYGAGSATAEVP
jgi:starch-binding outer membrane protein, SusD/RagB family